MAIQKKQSLYTLKKNSTEFECVKITSSKMSFNVIQQYYLDDIEIFESFFILLLNNANKTIGYPSIRIDLILFAL